MINDECKQMISRACWSPAASSRVSNERGGTPLTGDLYAQRIMTLPVRRMVKVPTVEEWVERYVASTGLAMWKFMRHWTNQGYSRGDAIKKAVPHGVGMLRESVGDTINIEEAEAVLRDIAQVYIALADLLRQTREGSGSVEPKGAAAIG